MAVPETAAPTAGVRFDIDLGDRGTITAILDAVGGEARPGDDLIILAHGAGNDIDSPFMQAVATGLTAPGRALLRFNFPYMEAARRAGKRRPPDRATKLETSWRLVADSMRERLRPRRLFLGGKSMGGRMASQLVADGFDCDGLVFLGYPLHPQGKPERLRKDHLARIACPMLFVQGTRDRLCDLGLLQPLIDKLPAAATLHRVEGGDHSFKVLKRLGRSEEQVMTELCQSVTNWIGDQ